MRCVGLVIQYIYEWSTEEGECESDGKGTGKENEWERSGIGAESVIFGGW